jgi:hypothetical protein
MPKHVFMVNHGQDAVKQIAEEYHAFALRAPLAPDELVTIEFRVGETALENSEAINIGESNSEAMSEKRTELEELVGQQIEVGMILRDTLGELYHVINEQKGPPKKWEFRLCSG